MSPIPLPSPIEWESTYTCVTVGGARYQRPIKSIVALRVGYKFWIPLRRSVMEHAFVRPVWKPRNSPDHILVQVIRVSGDKLVLRQVQRPIQPRIPPTEPVS